MTDVVLLIVHGSRSPAAAVDHAALCAEVAARTGADVRAAYLELDRPSITDAIDAAVDQGATRIRLIPHFLHPGNHVTRDLPRIAAAARSRHRGTIVVIEEHLGADPALVDLVADRIVQD